MSFLTQIKTARFVVPLIVLGKLNFFEGLQSHPKNTLRRTNKIEKHIDKLRKARKEGVQAMQVKRVSKAHKARRCEGG